MRKFFKKKSDLGYYLLLSPLLLVPVVVGIRMHSFLPLILYVIFAVAGVLGEILFEAWWNFFFHKPFWVYKFHPLHNGYSSTLNFIPWGFGGMLYLGLLWFFGTGNQITPEIGGEHIPFYVVFFLSMVMGIIAQFMVWLFLNKKKKFNRVTPLNYLLFSFPVLLGIGACAIIYGKQMILVAIVFALVAGWVEYMLGKILEFFLLKKYWIYNYGAVDGGHYTTLSLVPFALAGFYFWSVALVFIAIFSRF